jgi:uncharacterized ion transporter superfamily protein YfcC
VFFSADGVTILGIIVFILLVGVAFAVMERSGILNFALSVIVRRFGDRKYTLLLILTLFFMALGGFFGLLEEVVPLVPIMIALALFHGLGFAHRAGYVDFGRQCGFFNGGV